MSQRAKTIMRLVREAAKKQLDKRMQLQKNDFVKEAEAFYLKILKE